MQCPPCALLPPRLTLDAPHGTLIQLPLVLMFISIHNEALFTVEISALPTWPVVALGPWQVVDKLYRWGPDSCWEEAERDSWSTGREGVSFRADVDSIWSS